MTSISLNMFHKSTKEYKFQNTRDAFDCETDKVVLCLNDLQDCFRLD